MQKIVLNISPELANRLNSVLTHTGLTVDAFFAQAVDERHRRLRKQPVFTNYLTSEVLYHLQEEALKKGISRSALVEMYIDQLEYEDHYDLPEAANSAGFSVGPDARKKIDNIVLNTDASISAIVAQAIYKGVEE